MDNAKLKAVFDQLRAEKASAVDARDPGASLARDVESSMKRLENVCMTAEALTSIGIPEDVAKTAINQADLFAKHFKQIGAMTGGGLLSLYLSFQTEAKATTERIALLDTAPLDPLTGENLDQRLVRLRMLRQDRATLYGLMLDTYDKIRQAGIAAAMIELRRAEQKEAIQNKRSPKFSPLSPMVNMRVDGNVTVANGNGRSHLPAPAVIDLPKDGN
jgi:hypothetical protein